MNDTVIKAENVSKKYCRSIKHTMLYGATDLTRSFLGLNQKTEKLRDGEFWAVDDVNFEIKRGETLGIIGPNGSGKSTMLKLLNGIFMPDKGKIEIKGRVGALIEVGAGFHPMLTGRENIYVNGAILGMSKKGIEKKFDEIVEFADIGDFIDAPVKHYSSGMHVRLGFAIAVQCEPDILLVDEVLAVGDVGFRAKCYSMISDISKKAAVVIVSHSMPQMARICDRVIVMDSGNDCYHGDINRGIEHYYSLFKGEEHTITGSGRAMIEGIEVSNSKGRKTETIEYGKSLVLDFDVKIDASEVHPRISITLLSQELQLVLQCHSKYNQVKWENNGKKCHIKVVMPELYLNPGEYLLSIIIFNEANLEPLVWHHIVKRIKVTGHFLGGAPYQIQGHWSFVEKE